MLRRLAVFSLLLTSLSAQPPLALHPPMGWNSWDSFGLTVTESEFKANAQWLASNLKQHGWQYVVVDEGWYLKNPEAKPGQFQFTMGPDGRYLPAVNRFPSAASDAGFKPLADYVHSLGLKFGIHIIRGIPREAAKRDLPIAGSQFRAAEAADQSDTCSWNADNYGVKYTPAGQAYYDSLAKLYASWGLDFIKVDCIAEPYKGDEIRMISDALRKSGRPIVLSLSPGPAPLDKASELRTEANLWRISGDVWDSWSHDPKIGYAQSLSGQFPVAASWARYVEPDHWPDADMLPIGYLGPRPGAGEPRQTRFTHEEQRTLLSLWCIFRSPLFMGGNLTRMDEWTRSALTNDELIAVDQRSSGGHEITRDAKKAVWIAKDVNGRGAYVALFNLSGSQQTLEYPLQALGVGTSVQIRDVWAKRDLGHADQLKASLAPHDAALFHIY
ncbi:MAG TPA: glycoside hydrolase family 27 protein [Bryobacteraceae bacterium]|nr:glycoside hydrolase family 27 protein [Bryobacteraceae bacterium]